MADIYAAWSASIMSFPLTTQEQKHKWKCYRHQQIEQGKSYNTIQITHFPVLKQILRTVQILYSKTLHLLLYNQWKLKTSGFTTLVAFGHMLAAICCPIDMTRVEKFSQQKKDHDYMQRRYGVEFPSLKKQFKVTKYN